MQAAAGVTRLMHQCTAMLRERMCDDLRTPPAALPVRCAWAHGPAPIQAQGTFAAPAAVLISMPSICGHHVSRPQAVLTRAPWCQLCRASMHTIM